MTKMAMTFAVALVMLAPSAARAAEETGGGANANKSAQQKSGKKTISLADARARIDKAIDDPKVLKDVMAQLSPEDQVKFLADVNKAIGDMPASVEEKTALYLNANHAALTAAEKGNVPALTAETFATVPPEALTVICERFAIDLFNRSADAQVTYTDEQFEEMSKKLMEKVNERTAETDNGSARSAFAILMLVRASNGGPADLAEKLIDTLANEEARDLAKKEWIPAALGKDGREQGYEPLLASADAGRRPDLDFVLVIAGPQYLESILEDIVGKNTDQDSFMRTRTPVLDAVENRLIKQNSYMGGDKVGAGAEAGGAGNGPTEGEVDDPERPYNGQSVTGM